MAFGDPNVVILPQEAEEVLKALATHLHSTPASDRTVEWAQSVFLKLCKVGDETPVFVWSDDVQELRAKLETQGSSPPASINAFGYTADEWAAIRVGVRWLAEQSRQKLLTADALHALTEKLQRDQPGGLDYRECPPPWAKW